jgi:hypothetical protein
MKANKPPDFRTVIASVSCRPAEREHRYKNPRREQAVSQNFALEQFGFLRKEPAFLDIIEKLSWKYDLTLYDAATMAFAAFNGMQDVFNAMGHIEFDKNEHFKNYGTPGKFQRLGIHKKNLSEVHRKIEAAISKRDTESYFKAIDEAKEHGADISRYVYCKLRKIKINRTKFTRLYVG